MENYTVSQIGDETSNGNRIVKLSIDEIVETVLGDERRVVNYLRAVKADKVKVAVDDVVPIDISKYNVVERPFLDEHGELPIGDDGKVIDDGNGGPRMLKWLHLR